MTANAEDIYSIRLPEMIVNRKYIPSLKAAGMNDFERIYRYDGGKDIKRIKSRSVTRIRLSHESEEVDLYLKRHIASRPSLQEWATNFIRKKGVSPGMFEFNSICDFRKHGINTAIPVAAGERKVAPLCFESFLITQSIEPYISLETIIRYFPERLQGKKGIFFKQKILRAVADLARKMHSSGFNHLDFNANHVMIGPESEDREVPLALVDFQRIDRRKWMRFRWMIKTMAELFYSMPDPVFSSQDRRRMFERYIRRSSKGIFEQFLLGWITRKADRIGRHTEKINIRKKGSKKNHRQK